MGAPVPAALRALRYRVYAVLFVSPVTVKDELDVALVEAAL
jgi:hypothetical protein